MTEEEFWGENGHVHRAQMRLWNTIYIGGPALDFPTSVDAKFAQLKRQQRQAVYGEGT